MADRDRLHHHCLPHGDPHPRAVAPPRPRQTARQRVGTTHVRTLRETPLHPFSSLLRRRRVPRAVSASLLAAFLLPAVGGCRAQQPWPLWQAYTQRFVDDQGRVIDRSAHDRTTSEGQAYALFFALVDNDRPHFDKLLNWTEANLAQGDLTQHLPGWDWGQTSTGAWKLRDDNPASDADLWLAYTLLEAGRLWHDQRLDKLGRTVAARIASTEVVLIPGVGTTIVPGPRGFHPDDTTWILNPSYMPPHIVHYLARVEPRGPWSAVAESLPAVLGGGPGHGFAMDWLRATGDGLAASPAPSQPTASDGKQAEPSGSYDAIRVYLWVGMLDTGAHDRRELLSGLGGMAATLRTAVTPPLAVSPAGAVLKPDSPPGFSAAVVPYLAALGMKDQAAAQENRLAATRDPATGLFGRETAYYDQNLALFSTAFRERRFLFERDGRLVVRWK